MPVLPVSFGKVVAVSGRQNRIGKLDNKISYQKSVPVIKEDVTEKYRNAPRNGVLACAAGKGETVRIYISGDKDISSFLSHKKGWEDIDDVLAHMSEYYSTSECSLNYIKDRIVEKDEDS